MQNFLEILRIYGIIKDSSCRLAENYLATIGVTFKTITTLQKNLTEKNKIPDRCIIILTVFQMLQVRQ
mgnify:CR=1 FL=1